VIVVVGNPALRAAGGNAKPTPDGTAARIATAAARAGARVEIVGRVGDDPDGDALVLALSEAGVGHVALLRDAARPTRVLAAATAAASPTDDERPPDPAADDAATVVPDPEATSDLEAADVDLGLRYLTDFDVLVAAPDVPPDTTRAAATAAGWSGATPIVAIRAGTAAPADLPPETIVLEAPARDSDGAFADLVGAYAAAIDKGESPDVALRKLAQRLGWEPAPED
jgi:ribokinase